MDAKRKGRVPGIEAYFDGLCDPNPGGVATYGFLIKRDGKLIGQGHGLACPPKTPQATNNVAEYMGLIKALEWLADNRIDDPVVIRGDSDLIIKQVRGEYKVKKPELAVLHGQVDGLLSRLGDVTLEWIQRERNGDADRLTNLALAEYRGQSLGAPTTDTMTVDLVIAAPEGQVSTALRQAGLKARVTPVPGGAVRVQADLPAEPDAIRPLLSLKRRLEGSL